MKDNEIITDTDIQIALDRTGFDYLADEGRLMLMELLAKANAGYRSSNTEEQFLARFKLLNSDRTANKKGRLFLVSMVYKHSHLQPTAYYLMDQYRYVG